MSERRQHRAHAAHAGFTLVELMVALGILTFGLVSLLGLFSVGVSAHRSAEKHDAGARLVERLLHDLQENVLPQALAAVGDDPLAELAPVQSPPEGVPGYPGLRYRVDFVRTDALAGDEHADPELYAPMPMVLARIRVSWLQQGEAQAIEFQRLLRLATPFPQRVAGALSRR